MNGQDEGLHETGIFIEDEDARAEVKLRTTLEELASGCLKYVAITKNSLTGLGSGKTKLDKERMKLCEREIVSRILASHHKQFVYSHLFLFFLYRKQSETCQGI